MAKQIKEEYKIFMKDVEKNFKNKEDLEYLKKRVSKLMDKVLHELDNIEFKLNEKEDKIKDIIDKQNEMDAKVNKMQKVLNNIESDIYVDEGFDFEIVCPYCNNDFIIDIDENNTEVTCPECKNIIELDWSGNPEETEIDIDNYGCNGGCSQCPGCENIDLEDDM